MAATDQRSTTLDIINEVRRLVGLNTISTLTADKQARIALRLLNSVQAELSNAGDWHEMLASARVTAVVSTREYSIGVNHPVKNVYELSFSGQRQALEPIDLSEYKRYERGGGVGPPRFFTSKGVDNQSNPKLAVHPQPGSAESGNFFGVLYFKKPPLLTTEDADTELLFPADLLISGLYAKCLEEEAGGLVTRESIMATQDFKTQLQENLNRFNADSGSGEPIQLTPTGTR